MMKFHRSLIAFLRFIYLFRLSVVRKIIQIVRHFYRNFNPFVSCALWENLSNRSSGVQISCDICFVLGVICTLRTLRAEPLLFLFALVLITCTLRTLCTLCTLQGVLYEVQLNNNYAYSKLVFAQRYVFLAIFLKYSAVYKKQSSSGISHLKNIFHVVKNAKAAIFQNGEG